MARPSVSGRAEVAKAAASCLGFSLGLGFRASGGGAGFCFVWERGEGGGGNFRVKGLEFRV